MHDLQSLLRASAVRHHDHVCPRQVLGVRMGLYAAELLDLGVPQEDKQLFTFIETDGCLVDGIGVATGCWVGNRTMRVMDYGKSAATFVDTVSERAIRITSHPKSRTRALCYAKEAPDRWHAQLAAYQIMPAAELLVAQDVTLTVSLKHLISQCGSRVICASCGEDIINAREVRRHGHILCRTCAEGAYYEPTENPGILAGAFAPFTCERIE